MTRAVLSALLSHWRRAPLQLFTLLAGLALATALWSGVQAVNSEARASYAAAAETLGEGRYTQILPRDGTSIPLATYVDLRRDGWQVSPVLEGRIRVGDDLVRIVGVEPLTAPAGFGPFGEVGEGMAGQALFAGTETAEALTAAGYEVQVEPSIAPGLAMADISVAADLLDQPTSISRLLLAPGAEGLSPLPESLQQRPPQEGTDVAQLTDSFHLNLTAFGLLSFAVGIFIVHGAIGLAFEQRRAVFRTLRAMGVPLSRLIAVLLAELLIFALVAGTIGVALGYLIAAALLPDVAATLQGLYGASVSGSLSIRPEWWLSGLAIALAGTALAATGAVLQLIRLPVLAAAQARAWARLGRTTMVWQAGLAVALLVVAVLVARFGSGLVAGFLMLGALLIGAAMALPLVLDRILALGARLAKGPKATWFWADTRQQLRGLSLALMALLLAMAANVGVSTMVSSFRLTFIGFLDQRLVSEIYIYAETAEEAERYATAIGPEVEVILPIRWVDATLAELPGQVFGQIDHSTYRDFWTFLDSIDDPWAALHDGSGVLLNEQGARRAGLGVGDPLVVGGETFTIVGIHGDYGNPGAQAVVSDPVFERLFPDQPMLRFGIRTNDPNAIQARLIELGVPPSNIVDQAAIKGISLDIFERTFTVTGALNVLTLAVAGFAILMSLLTLAGMRLPQLAPVWALGMTRASLGWTELGRAILLALITAVLALPLGLVLAWILLAIINVEAFGWRLPMFVFPWDYARLGLFALLAAALAAAWPARKLARTPPRALLQVFSSER